MEIGWLGICWIIFAPVARWTYIISRVGAIHPPQGPLQNHDFGLWWESLLSGEYFPHFWKVNKAAQATLWLPPNHHYLKEPRSLATLPGPEESNRNPETPSGTPRTARKSKTLPKRKISNPTPKKKLFDPLSLLLSKQFT